MPQSKDKDWLNGYKNRTLYILSTRDPPQNKGHIQTENEGLEKDLPFLNKKKIYGTLRRLKEGGA